MIPPNQVKSTVMSLFDIGSPTRMGPKEKRDALRTMQKFLAQEASNNGKFGTPMLDAAVSAFDSLLRSSEHRDTFGAAIVRKTAFSCSLLRLMAAALSRQPLCASPAASQMLKVSVAVNDALARAAKGPSAADAAASPLKSLMEGYQVKVNGSLIETSAPTTPTKRKKKDKDPGNTDSSGRSRQQEEQKRFERHIKSMVEEALAKKDTSSVVAALSKMLLDEEKSKSKKTSSNSNFSAGGVTFSKAGLFVDWLERLDPELIQLSPEVQQQLQQNS